MKRFAKILSLTAGLGIVTVVFSFITDRPVPAQGPPPGLAVNVVNTPVPVSLTGTGNITGSVKVTNFPATQPVSGTVNVGNMPTVGITGTPNVNVTNPATQPLLVLNVNDPGRIPYQGLAGCNNCNFVAFPVVPSGHRLVIQHVSIIAFAAQPLSPSTSARAGVGGLIDLVMTVQPTDANETALGSAIVNQPVLEYFDADETPNVHVGLSTAPVYSLTATLTGYMLDCTIAPCAAIAP